MPDNLICKPIETVFLSLGSNLDDRLKNLKDGIDLLEQISKNSIRLSAVYESEPWGFSRQSPFLNCAVEMKTGLSPMELLDTVKNIEQEIGRNLNGIKWGPRKLDIDILLYGDKCYLDDCLEIPHPHLTERRFVLVPLADIASEIMIPQADIMIKRALEICTDECWVKPFNRD